MFFGCSCPRVSKGSFSLRLPALVAFLYADSPFSMCSNALARARGFCMVLPPVSSARYSLLLEIPNWTIMAAMGITM